MKQKKQYEQPETQVIELRMTNQLLAGSMGDRPDYVPGGDPFANP